MCKRICMSKHINFIVCIIFTAICCVSLMYAPQPLTPTLSEYFKIPLHSASLIVSASLIPLAIAPIVYGYFLEKFDAKFIIISSLFACSILQFSQNLSTTFSMFLLFRMIQSLFFPAILTSLLTLITRQSKENTQRNVSLYVSATIAGGLVGRVLGSFLAEMFSWHVSLTFFGILTGICGIWFFFIQSDSKHNIQTPSIKDFIPFLSQKKFLIIFGGIFFMFFSFQAVLSILPFAFKFEGIPHSDFEIGLLYTGYFMGIIVSLFSSRIIIIFGSRINAIVAGFFVFGISIFCMRTLDFNMIFWLMFLFCTGSFVIHTTFSGLINNISDKKGITNGIYLAFYYAGGVFGSYLPSFYYVSFGWKTLTLTLSTLLILGAILLLSCRKIYGNN